MGSEWPSSFFPMLSWRLQQSEHEKSDEENDRDEEKQQKQQQIKHNKRPQCLLLGSNKGAMGKSK